VNDGVKRTSLTVALGHWVIERGRSAVHGLDFLGATALGITRLLRGRTRHPGVHFGAALQEAGVETLPVVALFAVASGAVLTLLATQQLEKLGFPALAPRLVGIVILRELGALMVGIAVAGRQAPLGEVREVEVVFTGRGLETEVKVVADVRRGHLRDIAGRPYVSRLSDKEFADSLVKAGLRAAVRSSSPLAGQKSLDLDFHQPPRVAAAGQARAEGEGLMRARALAAREAPAPAATAVATVGVEKVAVPGWLDRPQVTGRAASGEVVADEFSRWGEPLARGVQRVVAENLAALLPDRRVLTAPFPPGDTLDHRVRVTLVEAARQADGSVLVEARWEVLGGGREVPACATRRAPGRRA
jgi:hypothetical protein